MSPNKIQNINLSCHISLPVATGLANSVECYGLIMNVRCLKYSVQWELYLAPVEFQDTTGL